MSNHERDSSRSPAGDDALDREAVLAGLGAEVLEDLGETGKSSGRRPQGGGRGERSGGGRNERSGGGERAPRATGTESAAPRRNRNRRRTRGGQSTD